MVNTEITLVPPKETVLTVFTTDNGLEPFLNKIREEIDAFYKEHSKLDLSKEANRKKIASMAHKVARSKTALDEVGLALNAQLKELPRKVDAERKRMRELLDKWRDEVRTPLTDWEETERKRINKINQQLDYLKRFIPWSENRFLQQSAEEIKDMLNMVKMVAINESYGEFIKDAEAAKNKAIVMLQDQLEKRIALDAEQAEQLRLSEEAKNQAAKKAEADRIEREKQVEIERVARELRIIEETKQLAEKAAQEKATQARLEAERREMELRLAAERAKREALEAEQRAKEIAQATEERLKKEALEKQKKEEAAQRKREQDAKHRAKINEEIAFDLLPLVGFNKELAQQVADELCSSENRVRHVGVVF
jgi:hypothetical protein